jgi:hypothetical protein
VSATGPDAPSGNLLDDLAGRYASAHRRERPQLLSDFVRLLIGLGRIADKNPDALEWTLLAHFRNAPDFVLDGSSQQQFACKLATQLGLQSANDTPTSVRDCVVIPLVKALIEVLRLGAPTTRDAAVEGLGALLRLVNDPAAQFPSSRRLPVVQEIDEAKAAFTLRAKISKQYFARLNRRRLMVLTIAGHEASRARFLKKLKDPIDATLARLLEIKPAPWEQVAHALNEHSDLLRILPAMARQGQELPPKATRLLCAAAGVLAVGPEPSMAILVELARFQESVFRTIDAALRRSTNWKWEDFDTVVAAAVEAIPQSLGGLPSVCNGQIRATVAILRTAIRVVIASGGSSLTKQAIRPLFHQIGEYKRWSNIGVPEGCYRGLAELIAEPQHKDLTTPALKTLFTQLGSPHRSDDLFEIHRHLIANGCLRRMLISLAGRTGNSSDSQKVERQLHVILREPTTSNIQRICQDDEDVKSWSAVVTPSDVSNTIIAGIAFERALLGRDTSLFQDWNDFTTEQRVLLTRILGAQLHSISRDAVELQRYPVLKRIFSGIESISLSEAAAKRAAWQLLATLPPLAAESADPEIQRFVEYCGWKNGDLPGYVLAMISPAASGRIAGAIAREIDLNLQRERRGGRSVDLAKSLHHVMLRGPHPSIFDHLLPRVSDDDRATVWLFRKHVASVLSTKQSGDVFDLGHIRKHLKSLLPDLLKKTSPTLQKLREALELFLALTANNFLVWKYITEKVFTLFTVLDELAVGERLRTRITEAFRDKVSDLQENVAHYLAMPVGDFVGRRTALANAATRAMEIQNSLHKHNGLQPPEQILLIALMQHLRDLFERTIRCYVDAGRLYKDANDPNRFWLYFCDKGTRRERIAAAVKLEEEPRVKELIEQVRKLVAGAKTRSTDVKQQIVLVKEQIANIKDQSDRVREVIQQEPPRFPEQREKFEEYFVEWRSSELDIDSLKKVLHERWPRWFRYIYAVMTNFWLTSLLILVPCGVAIGADYRGDHAWEGAGFFVITCGIIVAAMLSFTQVIHALARKLRFTSPKGPGYWFPCLLPRLARLTAVPMALIVEFDHSYEFPLGGSTWALLLLMVTSFVTTRFFVTREMVDRKEQPGVVKITLPERRRVRQIVGLALAHSFLIAVLLSAILAPSYERRKLTKTETAAPTATRSNASRVIRTAAGVNTSRTAPKASGASTPNTVQGVAGAKTSMTVQTAARVNTSTTAPKASGASTQSTVQNAAGEDTSTTAQTAAGANTPFWKLPVAMLDYLDATSKLHPRRRFLGVLPREVSFDLGQIAEEHGVLLPQRIREIIGFRFYPTIILTWTALGLFFGVFLEGFMQGKRLRGVASREEEDA